MSFWKDIKYLFYDNNEYRIKYSFKKLYLNWSLVLFNSISTSVGYLMPERVGLVLPFVRVELKNVV